MEYNEAIEGQPTALAESRRHVLDQLATLDLTAWRAGTIGVASMGASSHAGHVFARQLIANGRRVQLVDAAELTGYGTGAQLADSYLVVTEGGRSRETIEAARAVAPLPRLALTNVPAAPIADVVDSVLSLGHGPDSRVYTIGFTATLQAFGLLAEALTGTGEDWDAVPALVETTLRDLHDRIGDVADRFAGLSSIDVVGSGASLSAVHETALMLREGPRIPASGYETYQYLHGPMECQTERTGCIFFGGEREIALAQYAARHDIPSLLITSHEVAEAPNLSVLRLPSLAAFSAAITQILPGQLLVGELTRRAGIDIDEFRYDQDDTKVGPPLAGEGH
ncbi:SIS domain-containing protein [Jatrophihabitans telluris]|uniref:Glutamine--fructose-6-phosphate aminotransferase [isomerizing] n=1 Tax=Jatrophihabitans telluris TaxID=2038343 RepID=A0ABY4QWJ4_9ACTN|nr:SIS domain-containing protein [Jatrophihabitans telluris]UQX87617.1 SIS domain-containing protein [Jatrophihabitans telluris]